MSQDKTDNNTNHQYDLLYAENAKIAAIFWEWRHKSMTYFFAVIAGLFALAGWIYQNPDARRFFFTPFILGTAFSFVSLFLDRRNAKILEECYRVGEEIESKLIGESESRKTAIFSAIRRTHYESFTYTHVLFALYGTTGTLLLILSIWLARAVR